MPKCHLHLGTHKTGTTSIQAYAHSNRDRLLDDGFLYPDYLPVYAQKKAISSHHRFARAAVGADPELGRDEAGQLVALWKASCEEGGVSLLLSAENMSTLEDKQSEGNRRLAYWIALRDLLAGFDIHPVIVLRRQDQYVESFYKERVRNIFGYRPPSIEAYLSMQVTRRGMVFYHQSIASIIEVFGRATVLNFHDLAGRRLAANFMESAFGLDTSGYEQVGNERPSLSPVATAVKAELSSLIGDQKENNRFVDWLLSPGFTALAGRFVDPDARTSLFRDAAQRERLMDHFAADNQALAASYGIRFPPPDHTASMPLLPELPPEFIDACIDVLMSLREAGGSRGNA